MRTVVFVVVALAVALFVDAGIVTFSDYHQYEKRDIDGYMNAFRAGYEYQFRYDAQTSTNFADASLASQRALNRIQATVRITCKTPTNASLSLSRVYIAQHNDVFPIGPGSLATDLTTLQPLQAFAKRVLPVRHFNEDLADSNNFVSKALKNYEAQLKMPVAIILMQIQFTYSPDGSVESIQFSSAEGIASRNFKKAILNLIQLRLKSESQIEPAENDTMKNKSNAYDDDTEWSLAQRAEAKRVASSRLASAWTSFETTIEGKCAASYTVWPISTRNSSSNRYNVTKSIDFSRCMQTTDVLYGYYLVPTAACEPIDSKQNYKTDTSALWTQPTCGNMLNVPTSALQRSTVMRYTILGPIINGKKLKDNNDMRNPESFKAQGGVNKYAIERVNVVSDYHFQNGDTPMVSFNNARNAIRTLVVAELIFEKSVPSLPERSESEPITSNTSFITRLWGNAKDASFESLLYNTDFEVREKQFYAYGDSDDTVTQDATIADVFLADQQMAVNSPSDSKTVDKTSKLGRAAQLIARAEAAFDTIVSAYLENDDEDAKGISSPIVSSSLKQLVSLMRMCTMKGLNVLHLRATAAGKGERFASVAEQLYADLLAMAGTRNTIVALYDRIRSASLDAFDITKALRTLGSGAALFAPSDAQADTLLKTCDLLRDSATTPAMLTARDVCWLTFATMVGQLNAQSRRAKLGQSSPTQKIDIIADHKMDLYKNVLLNMLGEANTPLTKIMALKACGNAALDTTLSAILDVAQDAEQSRDVRMHAMDALRHFIVPRVGDAESSRTRWSAIASLLPIFVNLRDRPEIRMASMTAIIIGMTEGTSSMPSHSRHAIEPSLISIGEQIAFVLRNEQNEDVRGFVISLIRAIQASPLQQHRDIAAHFIKAIAGSKSSRHVFEKIFMRHSNFKRTCVDVNSETNSDSSGCATADTLLNYYTIYASRRGNNDKLEALPSQMTLQWDSFIGGEYQQSKLHFSVIQRNADVVIREVITQWRARFNDFQENTAPESDANEKEDFIEKKSKENIIKKTQHFLKKAIDGVSKIIRGSKHASGTSGSDQTPYAMLTLRNNGVDVFVWPITDVSIAPMSDLVKSDSSWTLNAKRFITRIKRAIDVDKQMDSIIRGVFAINEQAARVPTSVGMPIKMESCDYVFGALSLSAASLPTSYSFMAGRWRIAAEPNFGAARMARMRIWAAHGDIGVSAGATSDRHIELNLPLRANIQCSSSSLPSCEINVPINQEKVRLFGFHSNPVTIIASPSESANEILNSLPNAPLTAATRLVMLAFSSDAIDARSGALYTPREVENAYKTQQCDADYKFLSADNALSLPVRVHGHFHMPRSLRADALVEATAVSAVSNVHVDFEPRAGITANAVKFTLSTSFFQREDRNVSMSINTDLPSLKNTNAKGVWSNIRNSLDTFYSGFEGTFFNKAKCDQFHRSMDDENYESNSQKRVAVDSKKQAAKEKAAAQMLKEYAKAHKDAHAFIIKTLEKAVPFRHTFLLTAETVGASTFARADIHFYAVCDSRMRVCETQIEAKRTRWFADESQSPWSGSAQLQVIYPEMIEHAAQLDVLERDEASATTRRHAKIFIKSKAVWGSDNQSKQQFTINVLGEPSSQIIRQAMNAEEILAQHNASDGFTLKPNLEFKSVLIFVNGTNATGVPKTNLASSIPFIDQYKLVAHYELNENTQLALERTIGALKTAYFWQSKSQLRTDFDAQKSTFKAVLRVEANAPTFCNLSLETPTQRVFIRAMRTPRFVPLIALVSPAMAQVSRLSAAVDVERHDVKRMFTQYLPAPIAGFADALNAFNEKRMCYIGSTADKTQYTIVSTFKRIQHKVNLSNTCFEKIAGTCDNKDQIDPKQQFLLAAMAYRNDDAKKIIRYFSPYNDSNVFTIEPVSVDDWHLAVTLNNKRYTTENASVEELSDLHFSHGISFETHEMMEIVIVKWNDKFELMFNGIQLIVEIIDEVYQVGEQCGLCGNSVHGIVERNNGDGEKSKNFFNKNKFLQRDKICEKTNLVPNYVNLQNKEHQERSEDENGTNNSAAESVYKPVERTYMAEYNHKVCFSRQPIRQCAPGTYAADASGERDFLKTVKVPVVCLPRESLETNRIRGQINSRGVANAAALADYTTSYSEMVVLPERCLVY